MSWLANADPTTFWPLHPWSSFAAPPGRPPALAILPLCGFADHGLGLPLDAEEVLGCGLLREAVRRVDGEVGVRVLPPLRWVLGPLPATLFGIDPETAADVVGEIAQGVAEAGIRKLVFFNASPWNEEFIDAASRDLRVGRGLRTFVISLGGLGPDFHPARAGRAEAQAIAAQLLGTPPETPSRPAEVSDADFRPGAWRQPPPLPYRARDDGAVLFARAAGRLARLLREVARHGDPGAAPPERETSPTPPSADPGGPSVSAPAWPPFRPHYLPALTRDALERLADRDRTLVVLPTGAIEQHGHHLPVGVDAIMGQAWLERALPLLPAGVRVLVAPPLTYGKSNEHTGFPGTLSLSAKTLRRLVIAAVDQLLALGFRHIGIINTHGGNSAVLVYTVRELQNRPGLRIGLVGHPYAPDVSDQERAYGFHAGEVETSWMLALAPELVLRERATCEYPARVDDPGELRPENAPAIYSWITKDISRSGTMGDATAATAEKGERWLREGAAALARRLATLAPPA